MSKHSHNVGLKIQFGRIVADPKYDNGRPHILWNEETGTFSKNIDVLAVISDLRQGMPETEIFKKYNKLSSEDLLACRAWQARFMPETLTNVFNRHSVKHAVMLDENMSYKLLPKVVELFGSSSHVYADGLVNEHNDDEANIWKHAVHHRYKAIITKDDDFVGISARHRRKHIQKFGTVASAPHPLPVVIIVKQESRDKILDLLEKHQDDILKFMKDNDALYAELTPRGFFKGPRDIKPYPGPSNDNTGKKRGSGPAP